MVSRVLGRPVARVPTGASSRRYVHTAGYALTCVFSALVLVVSGFSYFVVRDVSSIGSSHAITGGPSIGAQNILLMGLESRRDWNGNILPARILNHLHAGSVQGVANGVGGNATNTLILLHIPAGGKKAIGFSIPRDNWVNFAGTLGSQQQGKIDQAYGVSMFYQQQQLKTQNPHITQNQLAFQGNEAGRKAAVDTVEQLTGVHIDHFAEVNLDGFYELANVLGGVEVCLNHAVKDANSGANFPAGYQHLNARAGAGVRPPARRPAQRRPGPDAPSAGLPRRGHAAVAHRGSDRRPDQDPGAALGGQAVRHHRRRLEPARLRHRRCRP